MILYFTGTGHSRYVAQAISTVTGDTLLSINDLLKNGSLQPIKSDQPFVFVCPTYAWRIPRVVEKFIKDTQFAGCKKVYFVLTCGAETGNAVHYIKRLCKEKGFEFLGFATILMPENYMPMYPMPAKEKIDEVIKKALPGILSLGEKIKNQQSLLEEKNSVVGILLSSVANPLFYLAYVKGKGFYSTETCNGCGKCAKMCPLNNIKIENKKPQWGNRCTHCMACICSCPKEAIEYKNRTKGQHRYYNTGYQQ